MGGILGLLDPSGVDRQRVSAAARIVRRGNPVIWAEGPFALGHYEDGQGSSVLDLRPDAVLAFDGRVDCALPGTEAAKLATEHATEHQAYGLLHAVLDRHGGAALGQLAADFAIARLDRSRQVLLLSRDAFGMRPLFWARRGRAVGFASDPDVLIAMGMATGELDEDVVRAYLSRGDIRGERTGFVGVRRFGGGTWAEHDLAGGQREGRWFRPEDVAEERWTLPDAADAVDEALQAAVADRCRAGPALLFLSGGRDSAAVAVAAARAGVPVTCVTKTYGPLVGCNEDGIARQVAESTGLEWSTADMPLVPSLEDLQALPGVSGTPLALPCAPEVFGMRGAIAAAAPATVLDGEGGDALFSAGPVAALDLLRGRRPAAALNVVRAFSRFGWYPPSIVAKTLARSVAPASAVRARDALRPGRQLDGSWRPPVRSAREDLLRDVVSYGLDHNAELYDRLAVDTGARWASPLLDQRVVRIALSLPVELRAPLPGPKPVLAKAFLGPLDASRRKTSFLEYYLAVAGAMRDAFPSWCGQDVVAFDGHIRGRALEEYLRVSDKTALLCWIGVEAWLRWRASER